MAENILNGNSEDANQAIGGEEEYEYEYVELGEGEELPEGTEYEYIEVSADEDEAEMPSMNAPSIPMPQVQKVISNDPYEQNFVQRSASPVVSQPEIKDVAQPMSQPMSQPIEEADLNALLDDVDEKIEEVDASALLTGDSDDDFARNLFANMSPEKIEEVSIDDILGQNEEPSLSSLSEGGIREMSVDDLLADLNENEPKFEISAPGVEMIEEVVAVAPVFEPEPEPIEEVVAVAPVFVPEPEPIEEVVAVAPVFELEPEPIEEVVAVAPVFEPEPEPIEEVVAVAPVFEPEPEPIEEVVAVAPVFEPEPEPIEEVVAVAPVFEPEPIEEVVAVAPVFEPEPIEEVVAVAPVFEPEPEPIEEVVAQISQVVYAVKLLDDQVRGDIFSKAKNADRNAGLQFWDLSSNGSILLNAVAEELADWHLILFNQNLVPVETSVQHIDVEQPQDTIRLATVVKQGHEKLAIYNEEEYHFVDPAGGFVKAQKHFIYGCADDNTGLIINDFINFNLKAGVGKLVCFNKPVFGWLSGPNGAQIYFAQLKNFAISTSVQVAADEDKILQKAAKWYSGNEKDNYYEFSLETQDGEFVGTTEIKNIHVNIGTSAYGWNVSFDNGVNMSLKDLQEFETKHGKMPAANGEIIHGTAKLKFSNVDKIVVYQTPQYFAYGKS